MSTESQTTDTDETTDETEATETPETDAKPAKRTRKAAATKATAPEPFKKRLWTAGPAPMVPDYSVIVPGKRRPYKFRNGWLDVTDEADYAFIKAALGGKVYEEDWPEDKPPLMNEETGFAPRSYAALQAHQRLLNN